MCRRFNRARTISSLALSILLGGLLACSSLPRHPRPSDFPGAGPGFSGEVAQAHRSALRGMGERWPGSPGDETARAYLARAFRRNGATFEEVSRGDRVHLLAEIPGASRDVVLLVATYPVLGLGNDWIDEAGAAVLVELARVWTASEPPYTLRFALAETRPFRAVVDVDDFAIEWEEVDRAGIAREIVVVAGRELALAIEDRGEPEQIRAIVALDLSHRPDPVFLRDLRSHPGFRKIFWESAARLGSDSAFPRDADWASPKSLHLGFRERSMDRVLALVDASSAPGESGGEVYAAGRGDSRSTAMVLDSVGLVIVDAIETLMRRLQKVDAFSR